MEPVYHVLSTDRHGVMQQEGGTRRRSLQGGSGGGEERMKDKMKGEMSLSGGSTVGILG